MRLRNSASSASGTSMRNGRTGYLSLSVCLSPALMVLPPSMRSPIQVYQQGLETRVAATSLLRSPSSRGDIPVTLSAMKTTRHEFDLETLTRCAQLILSAELQL